MSRKFEIGILISAVSDRLVTREGFETLHEFFEYLTGGPLWTHQLPRVADECRENILEQVPWLRDISVPDGIGPENYLEWLDSIAEQYGATATIEPLNSGTITEIDPIEELASMVCQKKVIVVVIDD